jgi:exo-1,4-beta-D-glucosaminidase
MISARNVSADDSPVSQSGFDASNWYTVPKMPATVLQVLQENGVYKNLYSG